VRKVEKMALVGSQNNSEFQHPQSTIIHAVHSDIKSSLPTRRSTRRRIPPMRLAYRAHANSTWIPPDLITEMQHAYYTEEDNTTDINLTDPYQFKIDNDDLIAVVLEKAPDKYKSIFTTEQRSKGTSLTLSALNSCMIDL
jgi:hypothetical protein